MSRARKNPLPSQNADWSSAFQKWMDRSDYSAEYLSENLGVSVRTVHRWRSGEAVPDQSRREVLAEKGAPPLNRAKKGPAASKRLEAMLADIITRLDRIEQKMGAP